MEKIGVIVGRFQVPKLTQGHRWLISQARGDFDEILILVGDTKIQENNYKRMDSHDPYPFEFRKKMIRSEFPEVMIMRFEDVGNLKIWNQKLDNLLETMNLGEYYLVGSRDSFVYNYDGKYKKHIIESPFKEVSGTGIRDLNYQEVSKPSFTPSTDFLKGVLWALQEKERLENLNCDGN